ncbi:MAG: tetratricopeptide repeat protein, partial [Pseudomonadota bacterium]
TRGSAPLAGLTLYDQEKYTEAHRAFDGALDAGFHHAARFWRGWTALRLERNAEALADFDAVLADPNHRGAFDFELDLGRAEALIELNRDAEALPALDRAKTYGSQDARVPGYRSLALRKLARPAAALAAAEDSLSLKPDYDWAQMQKALSLFTLARYGEAIDAIDPLLDVKYRRRFLMIQKAEAALRLGKPRAALETLRARRELYRVDLQYSLAIIQTQCALGNQAEAERHRRDALRLFPTVTWLSPALAEHGWRCP